MRTIGVSNAQLLTVTTELIEYPKALYTFSRFAINMVHLIYLTTSDHLVTLQCVSSDRKRMQKESWPILVRSWCGQQRDWQTTELSKTKSLGQACNANRSVSSASLYRPTLAFKTACKKPSKVSSYIYTRPVRWYGLRYDVTNVTFTSVEKQGSTNCQH